MWLFAPIGGARVQDVAFTQSTPPGITTLLTLLCCTQGKLQTLLQKVGCPIPEYTCQHSGPDHMPSFQATVRNGQCQLPAPLAPVTMLDTMNETAAMQCATWILC
jgi:hypothetical protein